MSNRSYDFLYKVLLIGNSNVGKTEILSKIMDNVDNNTAVFPSIENGFSSGIQCGFTILEANGKKIKLQIWDTAGHDRFQKVTTSYYRGALGVMLIYDVTDRKSFKSLKRWMKNIKEHADEAVQIFILGNNCTRNDRRQVPSEKAAEFAQKHGARFVEVSSKENINIQPAFTALAEGILAKMSVSLTRLSVVMGTNTPPSSNSEEYKPAKRSRCLIQ